MRRRVKWLVVLVFGVAVMMAAIYGSLLLDAGEPASNRPNLRPPNSRPLVIAHRGGAGLWPENTLFAFERASAFGVDVLELDVRNASDGSLVVIHDATVDRTSNGAGLVNEKSLAELKEFDAGYRWSPDGGKSFPLRGTGVTIPTLPEVFTALPEMRFIIEPKQGNPALVKSLCRIIREHSMSERVTVGSFTQSILDEFRSECPEVATSASTTEVSKFLIMYKAGLSGSYHPFMEALQIPERAGGLQVLTKDLIESAHGRNLAVHVWTVNETADMTRLLEMGVDGIMTDYPDRLMALLGRSPER